MHEHNYHIGAGFFITVCSCLLAVIVTATISSSFSKQTPSSSGVLSASVSNYHVKKLRAIHFHAKRRVCSSPRKHFIACMSEVSLGNNGKPLTGTPASTGALGPQQFHVGYN